MTGRGAVLIVAAAMLAVAGFAYGVEEFVLFAVAVAALLPTAVVLALVGSWRSRPRLRVELRSPPAEVFVGGVASITVHCVNVSTRSISSLRLERAARWSVSYPGLGARPAVAAHRPPRPWLGARLLHRAKGPARATALPVLRPGASWSWALPAPTTARGLWSLAPLRLWASDPFGLVVVPFRDSPSARLVVFPAVATSAASVTPEAARGAIPVGQTSRPTRRAGGDELEGLRPYQPGDRLNRLHWPALARSGDLLVRHFVEADEARLELYLDLRPKAVEGSVSAVAGSGLAALAAGVPLVVCASTGERLVIAGGEAGRRQLLGTLALASPARRLGP